MYKDGDSEVYIARQRQLLPSFLLESEAVANSNVQMKSKCFQEFTFLYTNKLNIKLLKFKIDNC